ncbi:MAG: 16S rRNA (uracil(1498)-N(3))-methyltransferase [Thermosipho sp. (in: Bacteria)]|nr:16S rRNA (uracil(1498)-N(3))-methyltransferase [Thermosipho sp. (in: thermotogales)]
MPNIFFCNIENDLAIFDEHETAHLKVTRKKPGDILICTDGSGNIYTVKLENIKKQKSFGKVLESKHIEEKSENKLILFAPSGKWERLRWLIEKSVELGVDKIYITKTRFSNRNYLEKTDKINLLIRNSCKQCVRYKFPSFEIINFPQIFKIAPPNTYYLDFNGQKFPEEIRNDVGIIVGPEGGFSKEETMELEKHFKGIKLGKKILRFETAAFVALSYFSVKLSKI